MANGGVWDDDSLPERPGAYVRIIVRKTNKKESADIPPKPMHLHVPDAVTGEDTI